MAWGDSLQWLLDLEQEEGVTPKPLRERPTLPMYLRFEWDAFHLLLRDRPSGVFGCIPFTAIDRFCTRFGIEDPQHFQRFVRIISAMETVLSEHIAEKTPRPPK